MHVATDTRSSLKILCWSGFLFYVYADTDPDADPDQTFQTDAFRILIQIKLFTLMRIRIQKIVFKKTQNF